MRRPSLRACRCSSDLRIEGVRLTRATCDCFNRSFCEKRAARCSGHTFACSGDVHEVTPATTKTDAQRTGPASARPRPALPALQNPCAYRSPRLPARPACWPEPGSHRQPSDQPRQRFRIVAAADPHPVTACQFDLDLAVSSRHRHQRLLRLRDNLHRQKAGFYRRRRP
jgi:hypothetical protein